jgi:DNA primase
MIDKTTIERVIETANSNIVDIIGDFVSLKKRGANYIGCCPFHNEKTGSFTVSPAKGFYKCFGCGKGGNAVTFVMEHEHMTFPEAIKYLGGKLAIEVHDVEPTPELQQIKNDRESMMALNNFAKEYFIKNLWENEEGIAVGLSYFRSRGFRDDIIRKFDLGYSMQTRTALTSAALAAHFKEEYLAKTGLSVFGDNGWRSDRFFGRVMFPIHSVSGKVVAFGGRVMVTDKKVAKYLNSPESELYVKSDIVYGIYHAKAEIIKQDTCYLVEGYTDVISMHQAGITNVVASSGTSLTTNQIRLIQRFTKNITVIYDGDNAGIKASLRGIDMILAQGMNVKVLLLPDGEDPDSFARTHTAEEYIKYIDDHKTDFIRFKANLLYAEAQNDPLKKSQLINDIIESISVIEDKVLRSLYVKECSKLMDIEESTLYGTLEQKLVSDVIKSRDEQLKRESVVRYEAMRQHVQTSENAPLDMQQSLPPAVNVQSPDMAQHYADKLVNPYVEEERAVLKFFVRYVDKKLFHGTKDETTVGEFVVNALKEDNIKSVDPLFNKILAIYTDASDRETVRSSTFINSTDPEVSSMAVDFVNNRYELSKIHSKFSVVVPEEDQLDTFLVRVMNELRLKIVIKKIEKLSIELKMAEESGETEEKIDNIVKELVRWNSVKAEYSKYLGVRVVL